MNLFFCGGREGPRPLPRPGPSDPSGPPPPRRPPPPRPPPPSGAFLRLPPALRCAARRASARPPYGRSSPVEPDDPVDPGVPYASEGDPVASRGAARRPGDAPDVPRRAAARPPPCGCGGLRRCSLIERLLLGQALTCAPGNGGWFPVPRNTDAPLLALTRNAPGTTTPTGVTWFPAVCMADRLRTAKTRLGVKFTPNQATRLV